MVRGRVYDSFYEAKRSNPPKNRAYIMLGEQGRKKSFHSKSLRFQVFSPVKPATAFYAPATNLYYAPSKTEPYSGATGEQGRNCGDCPRGGRALSPHCLASWPLITAGGNESRRVGPMGRTIKQLTECRVMPDLWGQQAGLLIGRDLQGTL